jgi:trehalose 6-phosphate phosphatase
MNPLDQRIQRIARSPVLLVASDYDGTLAPIVSDPAEARPLREAIVALRTLAALPQTHVAVISGRALRDLAALAGLPDEVHLVGSHGSEFDLDFAASLAPDSAALRQRIIDELSEITALGNGFIVESKPASVAFHYRNADRQVAERALRAVEAGPSAIEGVITRRGKEVIELAVIGTSKGDALDTLRGRVGASAVVFFGDDVTDEDAFATLAGPDIGVKVGPGESEARFRVDDPDQVAQILARLADLRADWLAGAAAVPIERHTLLSDNRTVALITPDARIVWLCLPRIDSPAIFAEILGGPTAGYFAVEPMRPGGTPRQRYRGDSMIAETRWADIAVTDFLDCSNRRPQRRAGRTELIRRIEGTGWVRIEFAPRLDFGRIATRLVVRDGGLAIEDTPDPIVLRAPGIEWTITSEGPHQTARAEVDLSAGPVTLELVHGSGRLNGIEDVAPRHAATVEWWDKWAASLVLPPIAEAAVKRSALLLKSLCYTPTGAIAAAATTSLPESIGGVRNWDYRYCWLRDGALSAASLVRLGSIREAMQFLDWVLGVLDVCESPERLRPLYSVTGGQLGSEAEIGELAGYCGSRPVRIGNGAAHQVQLDVFGPIVELVALLLEHDAPVSAEHWRLVRAMVSAVQSRWHEPDHGIWEIRKPRRHHVHSKVMCWLAVDRAIEVGRLIVEQRFPEWVELRRTIQNDILAHGFDSDANTFKAAYDGSDLDAAALTVGLSGLLPPDDPRFRGTVDAIEAKLRDGPAVYRYRADDGLPGFEGAFHLCTGWLIRSYLLLGRAREARELFDQVVDLAGPTGLLSEQYGPHTGRALGNVPQAFSHLSVIDCAVALATTQDSSSRSDSSAS